MKVLSSKISIFCMLIPFGLNAQDVSGAAWYGRFIGGVGVAHREEIKMVHSKLHPTGYVFAGALGYETCHNFRVEGEIAYRRHSIRQLLVNIQNVVLCQPACGHFGSLSFMANFLFNLPCDFWFASLRRCWHWRCF